MLLSRVVKMWKLLLRHHILSRCLLHLQNYVWLWRPCFFSIMTYFPVNRGMTPNLSTVWWWRQENKRRTLTRAEDTIAKALEVSNWNFPPLILKFISLILFPLLRITITINSMFRYSHFLQKTRWCRKPGGGQKNLLRRWESSYIKSQMRVMFWNHPKTQ